MTEVEQLQRIGKPEDFAWKFRTRAGKSKLFEADEVAATKRIQGGYVCGDSAHEAVIEIESCRRVKRLDWLLSL